MTQKTKLEIIGPYTPEHEGPFCTEDGVSVRILCTNRSGAFPIVGLLAAENNERIVVFTDSGVGLDQGVDLMNAREVPVAREFWINEYAFGEFSIHTTETSAKLHECAKSFIRTTHVREVLPGNE